MSKEDTALTDSAALLALLIPGLLVWLPVLLFQIERRGLLVLLVWLLTAPIATNIITHPTSNPLFGSRDLPAGILIQEILDPTRFLFTAFIIVVLLGFAIKRRTPVPWDRTEIWMGVFSLILVANTLLLSRQTLFGLHVAVDAFIIPFTVYYLTRRFVTTEDDFRRLMIVLGYLGFYLIVIALVEQFTLARSVPFYRLQGPFRTRDLLYIVIMVTFFSVLLGSVRGKEYSKQRHELRAGVRLFVVTLAPLIILFTWTRGNWLGFIAALWLVIFLGRRFLSPHLKTGAVGATLVLLPLMILLGTEVFGSTSITDRIANTENAYGRLAAWQSAIQVAMNNPIFGIGLNNLRDVLSVSRSTVEGTRGLTVHHNCYLGFLVELGAVGLLTYLLMVSSIIRTGFTLYRSGPLYRDRWRGIAVIAIMTAYLIPAFFSTILYSPAVSHIYVFACVGAIAGLYGSRRRASNMKRSVTPCRTGVRSVASGLDVYEC